MSKHFVTAKKLAAILDISVETIWRYTRNDKIPYVKLANNKYRYDADLVVKSLSKDTANASLMQESRSEYITDKTYTYEEYLRLPEEPGYSYQILDGMLIKDPAPYVQHQRISRRLQRILEDYLLPLDPKGEVFDSPIDMTLTDTNVVQPDLVYISGSRLDIIEEARINGIPDLVVEIVSPSSRSQDRIKKRAVFERVQIPHYWLVDYKDMTFECYALKQGAYIIRSAAANGELFTHPDFPELEIELEKLWVQNSSSY